MEKTKEVTTSIGIFEVKKPKAGVRNRAISAAETDSGKMKTTLFMMILLPKCINRRPEAIDDTVPMDQILDDMETEDYDLLVEALSELLYTEEPSEEKKA